MLDLPKSIQVLFSNNPKLAELVPNPIVVANTSFISAFSNQLCRQTSSSNNDEFYRIVFKKGSSRELMTINNGELKGLLTSTCIEKGKISDVAGLEQVDIGNEHEAMPALLGISLYSSIKASLSYISQLSADIRNHQIIEEQAKFERVSETISDSFRSIPDISVDKAMRSVYLSRIVKNNEDCYELYVSQRYKFAELLDSEPQEFSTGYNYYFTTYDGKTFYPDRFFTGKVMKHSIFSVFERLVAGRICEIVISGNYSQSNIQRHKDFIDRIKNELMSLMSYRLSAFNNFTENHKDTIETDLNLTGYEREKLQNELNNHLKFVNGIQQDLSTLLDEKLDGFNILSHLMDRDEFDVYLIDGKLLISNCD
ncbi:hypothetical protein [Vibrio parahaemolyticus]|uniref:hypothetical protein n=1 Tax=Vibrio parahaemolyticus TaxID=670 RepID=UPI00226BB244|nr:hypothetical protein [Vibrio parahaemolyticus]EGR3406303.1 hypothetical protein [Vibrio parahaemolyticus]MCX8890455.1 hypothetical protein [Vibrio parahaemolyticus]HCG7968420.1 hypothetical protein [Vibrio parahaemolyticus]HCH2845247.1 hypothetical protein [Vibrio parahaemolyticus]